VTTDHFVIDSVVGESVPIVDPVVVPSPPTPYVLGALEDATPLESYSTHVASLIWQHEVFICVFYVFVYLFVLFHMCVLC